jgi:dTDP-4-amino-4,6-dideoxygalactose transaminase
MKIPQLDLKAQYQSIKNEIDKKLAEVLSSQRFILGPEVNSFESEMSAFLGVSHAVGVSSGSDALIISLMALGIGQGDAVVKRLLLFLRLQAQLPDSGQLLFFATSIREPSIFLRTNWKSC